MHLTKERPKVELQIIKDLCKEAGFDYGETPLSAEYDTMGNIVYVDTPNKKLQKILKDRGLKEET